MVNYDTVPMPYWQTRLDPMIFFCMVCNPQLHGIQKLAKVGLPSQYFDVNREDIDPGL